MKARQRDSLLETLRARFVENPLRHEGMGWEEVRERLEGDTARLQALDAMERTGGEPDVVALDTDRERICFVDCSRESPAGRRSLCYDRAALDARKANKPQGSAVEMAAEIGIEMLDERRYRRLQELGEFDLKTSSWIATPEAIRELGGALFCDRRYDCVFTYHNGAQSYYAARGFRGLLRV
ncbi:MAG: DUF4256 domain-containing protein [Acidobacteria bacterium]|nr:MAG: DUF4256 domain-containing protein [Acidobacteriota bacterium]REK11493.1 MAG: DUF4256 domain-containing protein [Acidobacteriota bacterium]